MSVRFYYRVGYTRMRELNMVYVFDFLNCILKDICVLFNCFSVFYKFVLENVTKMFQSKLVFMIKVCTFATAFESETHERDEILTTECKPDILLVASPSVLPCMLQGSEKGDGCGVGFASDLL